MRRWRVVIQSRVGSECGSRAELPKVVLEDKIYGFGKEVSSNSVEVHVSRLRKRLAGAGANVSVHTLRGVGYLLSEESTLAPQ